MLRRDVVEAVEQGKFHIYSASTIDEGIEVLTDVPAGQRDDQGHYPVSSVNGLVEKQLREYSERAKRLSSSHSQQKRTDENEEE